MSTVDDTTRTGLDAGDPRDPTAGGAPHGDDIELFDPDEWATLPARSTPLRRFVVVISAIAAVLLVFVVFSLRWIDHQIHPSGPPGAAVVFTIRQGASTNDVASDLKAAGVIGNPTVFRYWLRREEGDISFKAGEYDLQKRMDYPDVVTKLKAGPKPPVAFKVLIPPGLTVDEMKKKMLDQLPKFATEEFDAALIRKELDAPYVPPLPFPIREGLLFPDTYNIDETSASNEFALLKRMRDEMDKVLRDLDAENRGRQLGLSTYQVLIVASLIEEEAKVDDDRPKIARVIYNRLDRKMPLGIDATVRFAVNKRTGDLTQSDLNVDSAYNTRKVVGLPPTPIASPSRKSIEAALAPADGSWLYYVLTDEGGVRGAHTFATTSREFEAAKKVCVDKGYCK